MSFLMLLEGLERYQWPEQNRQAASKNRQVTVEKVNHKPCKQKSYPGEERQTIVN